MQFYHLIFMLAFGAAYAEISDYAKETAMTWAPIIWLHSDEQFYPSTTDFYIENMELRDAMEEVVQEDPTASDIMSGEGTEELHLNTVEDIKWVNDYEDFFYGQPLEDFVVYVHVHEYGDECNTVDVKYSVFYPFNYGKDVCVGLPDDTDPNGCRGVLATFGNHMSDWEGIQIRFRDGVPTDMEVSAHSFGAWYTYDAEDNIYRYRDGEQLIPALDNDTELVGSRQDEGDDNLIQLRIEYPQEIYMYEDTHAEVFSACGSHGMWGQPGEWIYVKILWVNLNDQCDRGEAIKTWEKAVYIDRNVEESTFDGTELQWVNYQGYFGNQEELRCALEFISGECGFTSSGRQPGVPEGPSDAFEACDAYLASTPSATTSGSNFIKIQPLLLVIICILCFTKFI